MKQKPHTGKDRETRHKDPGSRHQAWGLELLYIEREINFYNVQTIVTLESCHSLQNLLLTGIAIPTLDGCYKIKLNKVTQEGNQVLITIIIGPLSILAQQFKNGFSSALC